MLMSLKGIGNTTLLWQWEGKQPYAGNSPSPLAEIQIYVLRTDKITVLLPTIIFHETSVTNFNVLQWFIRNSKQRRMKKP